MQLFHFHTPEIKVTVDAYFENGNLVIEGYDIGKTVKEYWGDSDYEYTTTVKGGEVWKLYPLFNIPEDENLLLEALARKFNNNTCFSDFRNFCDQNQVKYESFSWT
ncbi:hypothetical protein BH09BAC3_BH09BAC3_08800 [soil metagenome]